jgi:hypothetical protein
VKSYMKRILITAGLVLVGLGVTGPALLSTTHAVTTASMTSDDTPWG